MAERNQPDLLVEAWAIVAERGWRGYGPVALARRTGRPLVEIYALFPDRRALLTALGHRLDAAMLDVSLGELEGMSVRERLFELLMRRFEAMKPFRAALRAAGRAALCDRVLLCGTIANLDRAADWLLAVSEAELSGMAGHLGRRALQLAYLRSFKVWLEDDTADLARTMAELDRRLGELETAARFFGLGRGARERRAGGSAAGSAGEAPAPA